MDGIKTPSGVLGVPGVLNPGGELICLEFFRLTTAWFRRLYDLHSFIYMPLVMRTLGRFMPSYIYLPESIRTFPLPDELSASLERIGALSFLTPYSLSPTLTPSETYNMGISQWESTSMD